MRRSEGVKGTKPLGSRIHPIVIALSSSLAGCAGLLGVGDDQCRKGTLGCGDVTQETGPTLPPAPSSDETPADASTPVGMSDASVSEPSAPDVLPPGTSTEALCERYCQGMSSKCSGENVAYLPQECAALCPYFPRALDGGVGNTLECRLSVVDGPVLEPRTDCPGAGRGGDSVCGSNCDAYCQLMQAICPVSFQQTFETNEACQRFCLDDLEDPGGFDAVQAERDVPSTVQCRLWHLGAAAALGFRDNGGTGNVHCTHARGAAICVVPADADAAAP
jgi:hypothetical protein